MTRSPTEAMVEAAKYIDRALWQEERLGSDLSGVNWQAVVGLMRGEMLKAKAALAAGPGSVEAQGTVPKGWKLVPVEPTSEMEAAYQSALKIGIENTPESERTWRGRKTYRGPGVGYSIPPHIKARWRWAAMLNAAPAGEVER